MFQLTDTRDSTLSLMTLSSDASGDTGMEDISGISTSSMSSKFW